jgi:PAT family beta-lactamase induction signal transducer AmpG
MSHREQAAYVGIQGIFWNLGRIIADRPPREPDRHPARTDGAQLAPVLDADHGRAGGGDGALLVWHLRVLPTGGIAASAPGGARDAARTFKSAFTTFFAKKMIWRMIAVAYFYRFGEGLIDKIGPLFLLDRRALGGLELDNVQLGTINGPTARWPSSWARSWAASSPRARACARRSSSSCSP